MNSILLSVRPTFARALMDGTKTAEVRRRFPAQPAGSRLFVYSSSPDRAVIGTLRLDSIDRPNSQDVWRLYAHQIEIDEEPLDLYLEDTASAAILHVSEPALWNRPVPLSQLRSRIFLEPPQSFRYLTIAQSNDLERLGAMPTRPRQESALIG